jgi:tetratricopeptide (TPR) repeat protein
MGSVTEPYLTGTPDVGVFAGRFVYEGFSFGEAAYSSQLVLSWQTTVVGDPLYRPFAKNPDLLMDELQQRHSKWLDWAYLRLVNVNLAIGRPMSGAVALLEQLDLTTNSAVLTEKLGDLYEAQGKPSSAVHSYEEALNLEPSPQQRVRLLLTLGEKLAALDRDDEAYQVYQRFLRTVPDFPDPLAIYRKLLSLAQKLKKTQDAAKYEAEIAKLTPPPPKS